MKTCTKPDRDVPKLVCGFPLPCPYHSVILDFTAEPVPTITIPVTAPAAAVSAAMKLARIASELKSPKKTKTRSKRARRKK